MLRFTLLIPLLWAPPVAAKNPIAEVLCEPTDKLHAKLTRQFGASREATGIRSPEQVMEVWTGKRGDWALVVTYATGTSCIVAMGEDWVARQVVDPA